MKSTQAFTVFLTLSLVVICLGACLPETGTEEPIPVAEPVASPTPYPTYTPYPTFTPVPATKVPATSTPYPTYTPHSSPTPYPTLEPYPTYTPYPSPTPTPIPEICNPSWRIARKISARIGTSVEDARSHLENELKRNTRVEFLPSSQERDIQIYLTYLSPQVLEAIVLEKAVRENLTVDDSLDLLNELDRRLQTKNAIPFLIVIRGNDERDTLNLGKLEDNIVILNQHQEEISPLIEYSPSLAEPMDMSRGGREGIILFPRTTDEVCNPTVNILNDHSFDVRMRNITGEIALGRYHVGEILVDRVTLDSESLMWSYTLLPDIPLDEALDIPLPQRATSDLPEEIVKEMVGLTLSFLPVVVGIIL